MAKPKHTPGPWKTSHGRRGAASQVHSALGSVICGIIYATSKEGGDMKANARLIAAAPDLLEALDKIERETIDKKIQEIARKAIQKAEGK